MEFLIVLAILFVLVLVVSAPLRQVGRYQPVGEQDLAELEAARDAKYREIRDADLDHRTGKLSDFDYAELDRELRAEAIDIMRALDRTEQLPSHET